MTIKKVALFGANGSLGTKVLEALVAAKCFDISVVLRATSTSKPPPFDSVNRLDVPANLHLDSLTDVMSGQDAVIVCIPIKNNVEVHLRLAEAAMLAGVRRYVPSDFASCDADSPRAQELVALYKHKAAVRARCKELARDYPDRFSWTAIVGGHFFDWGMNDGFMHVDIPKRSMDLLDGGKDRFSTATLPRLGEAVVAALQREEATRNKLLFVQSFCITQLELLTAFEKATGSKWSVRDLDSGKFVAEQTALRDGGSKHAIEELVFVLGTVEANWEAREEFGMKTLGLENESLDEVVAGLVAKFDGPAS